MSKKLVIVESPAKAKTIERFLGPDFRVMSSMGHIRDLPKKKLGVNTRRDFEPEYTIPYKAQKTVSKLKSAVRNSKDLYLATDLDREGEAIAWHVAQVTKPRRTPKRITFDAITKSAIFAAIKKPRGIDLNLVNAQQARRVLDRLVGYKLSPLLWRKVASGLSAGRVQSVAVRLIVEREEEIKKFKPQEFWSIAVDLKKKGEEEVFQANLTKEKDKKIDKLDIKNESEAKKIEKDLNNAKYIVSEIKKEEKKRYPSPPFTTSTLQQTAFGRYGFPAKKTMVLAQQLYEGIKIGGERVGLITYMRTDSLNMAASATKEAKNQIVKDFGEKYALDEPRFYKTKSKGAQEAHEAIRPTHFNYTPEKVKNNLDRDQLKLYSLIWKRAIATQMQPAVVDATTVEICAKDYTFRANGSIMKFDGFIKAYAKNGTIEEIPGQVILPELKKDEELDLEKLIKEQHFTEPPARYTEASLIKALEEKGIGRPSTYAPTISTIQDRHYVKLDQSKFVPEEIGILVTKLLKKHFPKVVDYDFTAKIEEELDEIAAGDVKWVTVLREFYDPFKEVLKKKYKELDKSEITEEKIPGRCPKCGKGLMVKMGRFGKFISCRNYPKCKFSKPYIDKKTEEKVEDEKCEKCGSELVVKEGRFGPFLACKRYPKCRFTKSLPQKGPKMKCPDCGEGEVVIRHTKRGRKFWGCSNYPKCKWASWTEPKKQKELEKSVEKA